MGRGLTVQWRRCPLRSSTRRSDHTASSRTVNLVAPSSAIRLGSMLDGDHVVQRARVDGSDERSPQRRAPPRARPLAAATASAGGSCICLSASTFGQCMLGVPTVDHANNKSDSHTVTLITGQVQSDLNAEQLPHQASNPDRDDVTRSPPGKAGPSSRC